MTAPNPDSVWCAWPLSHRNKHGVYACSCICRLVKGHDGKHLCEREAPAEEMIRTLLDAVRGVQIDGGAGGAS